MTCKIQECSVNHEPDRSFKRVRNQFLMVFLVNILPFGVGCNIGWYSPALPVINQIPSPLLDAPITENMAGWIGSFLSVGATSGCLFFGLLANWIGYKRSLLLSSIPLMISWLCIIFGVYAWQILLSRFLSGLAGGAVYACIPPFVAEIASDHIRGQLNSYVQIAFYSGILGGYIGGSYIPYNINPIVMLILPIIFVSGYSFMPESPQYLLKTNKAEAARKSLRYYRNIYDTDGITHNSVLNAEFDKFEAIAHQTKQNPPLKFADFVTPRALKAIMICPFLMTVSQFSGAFAISNYAETIFKETGSTVDPQISSIVMGTFQVIGNYTAAQLMDKVGRKVLLLVSLSGAIVALLVTGTFSYFIKEHDYDMSAFNWVPLVSITFFIFICAVGILPVPYVMMAEVLPQKIRRIATTMCTTCVYVFQATMLRLMPLLLSTLQLYGSMWLFASVATIGLIFSIVVVKETKGINLDVLEEPEKP